MGDIQADLNVTQSDLDEAVGFVSFAQQEVLALRPVLAQSASARPRLAEDCLVVSVVARAELEMSCTSQ